MFHGVQARNQIFLGEFQLSDKVGCILSYPGSYPHSTLRYPSIPCNTRIPVHLILARIVPAAIPLPLGEVNPSVAAWIICTTGLSAYPSYCHRNLVAKTRIANITNVMLHKQPNIFMMKTPSSKSVWFSVYELIYKWLQKTLDGWISGWDEV